MSLSGTDGDWSPLDQPTSSSCVTVASSVGWTAAALLVLFRVLAREPRRRLVSQVARDGLGCPRASRSDSLAPSRDTQDRPFHVSAKDRWAAPLTWRETHWARRRASWVVFPPPYCCLKWCCWLSTSRAEATAGAAVWRAPPLPQVASVAMKKGAPPTLPSWGGGSARTAPGAPHIPGPNRDRTLSSRTRSVEALRESRHARTGLR
mmetsp:Transcript_46066/g.62658  ORF Transcript_46066/g.62658 Transcript_46066/m.62658 type:complete len:206 (+) Transcript_46066:147-764(+)